MRAAGYLSILGLLLAVPAAVASAGQVVQNAEQPEDEIVVVGRKLRKVRLQYSLHGPYLRSCFTLASSGDEDFDRLACVFTKRCIDLGHREPMPAMLCVRDLFVEREKRKRLAPRIGER